MNDILNTLHWRYAVKVFDSSKKVSKENIDLILESARLSPSAYGLEPWKFFVVENEELRKKIREVGYDQTKITDASHLIIITYRTDAKEKMCNELMDRIKKTRGVNDDDVASYKQMIDGDFTWRDEANVNSWMKSQAYISVGFMLETAALLGIDAGPMEGFNTDSVDEILGLKEKNLHSTVMIAFGYRGDDSYANLAKVRKDKEDVVEWIT